MTFLIGKGHSFWSKWRSTPINTLHHWGLLVGKNCDKRAHSTTNPFHYLQWSCASMCAWAFTTDKQLFYSSASEAHSLGHQNQCPWSECNSSSFPPLKLSMPTLSQAFFQSGRTAYHWRHCALCTRLTHTATHNKLNYFQLCLSQKNYRQKLCSRPHCLLVITPTLAKIQSYPAEKAFHPARQEIVLKVFFALPLTRYSILHIAKPMWHPRKTKKKKQKQI